MHDFAILGVPSGTSHKIPLRLETSPNMTRRVLRGALTLLLSAQLASAAVNFPGVEYNAAIGGSAIASSYYDFSPNPLLDTTFVPQNAVDGFPDTTSWWAAGNDGESVFWQVNLTAPVPRAARIVVRWHGFLTPTTYRVRISYNGEVFSTISVVRGRDVAFDRVDNITDGLDDAKAFRYLQLALDAPNTCASEFSCSGNESSSSSTGERVIYGIREVEIWARGNKNGGPSRKAGVDWGSTDEDLRVIVVAMVINRCFQASEHDGFDKGRNGDTSFVGMDVGGRHWRNTKSDAAFSIEDTHRRRKPGLS